MNGRLPLAAYIVGTLGLIVAGALAITGTEAALAQSVAYSNLGIGFLVLGAVLEWRASR